MSSQSLPQTPTTAHSTIGDTAILGNPTFALVCSVSCPGNVVLRAYDLAVALRDTGITVIGGFHSPMEQEILSILLRGTQPIIVCPARGVDGMRVPTALRAGIADGRLLLLSPFTGKQRRATAELADERNRFVAAKATQVFIAHAVPGGKTEGLCREVLSWGKPVYTFDSPSNAHLIAMGAVPVTGDADWVRSLN